MGDQRVRGEAGGNAGSDCSEKSSAVLIPSGPSGQMEARKRPTSTSG